MIVRYLHHLLGTEREVRTDALASRRLLLARDGQPYSVHDTLIVAGAELHMWYKHHIESVYCVAGEGELENCETGEVFPVQDGMFYCLDGHDPHVLRARTDLRLICIFMPALVGPELHDAEGAFPILSPEPVLRPMPMTNLTASTLTPGEAAPLDRGTPQAETA
jgi:L-ectoine synthase